MAPWALLGMRDFGLLAPLPFGLFALELLALLALFLIRMEPQLVTRVDSVGAERGGAHGEIAGSTGTGAVTVGGVRGPYGVQNVGAAV